MMTWAKIIRQWGVDNLVRVPDALLQTVDLPADTKDFLRQVGIPKRFLFQGGDTDFEALPIILSQSVPATGYCLLQRLPETSALLLASSRFQHSSHPPQTFLYIQEGEGIVGLADTSGDERQPPFLFVNSNIQAWVECLWISQAFLNDKDGDFSLAIVRAYKRRLERVDPHAFDETHPSGYGEPKLSYWPWLVDLLEEYF